MIDFFGPGWQVAERMQLITKLKDVGYRISKVVWMSPHHQTEASLDYALLEKMLDGKFMSIMRGDLERSLFEGLPQQVEVRFGSSVQAIETRENGITVLLTNGAIENADLLIGADGIHSRIRDLIFGKDPRFFRYLGYHTAALTFNDGDLNHWLASECKIISAPGIEADRAQKSGRRTATWIAPRTKWQIRLRKSALKVARFPGFEWFVKRMFLSGNRSLDAM